MAAFASAYLVLTRNRDRHGACVPVRVGLIRGAFIAESWKPGTLIEGSGR